MLELFLVFFKAGIITVGGGLTILPVMEPEILGREWVTAEQMNEIIAIGQSMPGPFAVNMSTFVGYRVAGVPGALAATAGLIAPALILMMLIGVCFKNFGTNRRVAAALNGVRPVVLGLIATFIWLRVVPPVFIKQNAAELPWWQVPNLALISLFFVLFALDWRFKLHPVAVIVISMAAGVLLFGVLGMKL